MTSPIDPLMLQNHLNDLILRHAEEDSVAPAMSALSVALRFADGGEFEALLTLSRHQQSAFRQLTAH